MNKPIPPAKDALAAESWLDEHGDALYRYALVRVRNAAAAEDLVQETLLAALTARERFAGQSSVRTWLIAILKNKLIDYLRRHAREAPLADDPDDDLIDAMFQDDPGQHWRSPPSVWANPAGALEQTQFWEAFTDCLQQLPPRQAKAFGLCELDGLTGEEACKVLELTASNLWVLMHRARLRLRQCLETRWFGRERG
jgi:RNA polymerase sigma-70 factor (ECF subfamily)